MFFILFLSIAEIIRFGERVMAERTKDAECAEGYCVEES